MRFRSYSSDCIVLSRRNYSEADRILTVYSKHYGKIKLLAKGVRKPKSRKRGHIEVFSLLKFSAARGKGMDIITEAELVEPFDYIRKDLAKTALAFYFCEVVEKITREEERNEGIFEELSTNLELLTNGVNLKKLRKNFVYKLLVMQGFLAAVGEEKFDIDKILAEVTEREISSFRIGKRILI